MFVATPPRQMLSWEYRLIRLPAQLVQTRVVTRYLEGDNPGRLGYERLLGAADGFAGRVLHNEKLIERGDALRRRVELLAAAEQMEQQAQAQRTESRQALREQQEEARTEREQAAELERQRISQASEEAAAAKSQAQEQARKAAEQAARRAEAAKQRSVAAARSTAEARTSVIDKRVQRATAAPKAELRQAGDTKAAARAKRSDAAALGSLTDRKRRQRKSS